MELWGQIAGIVAMLAIILSFQCKSNKNLVIVYGTGALLFGASYFMLGQASTAYFNIISFICSVICLKESLKTKLSFGIIAALFILATYFAYDNWWSIVLMVAVVLTAYFMMFESGSAIRYLRFFFVSPVWLINNTVICFSIGGILCEVITMISVIVSFIRFKKTGFEK